MINKTETAMMAAFKRSGVQPWQVKLDEALALAMNQRVSFEDVVARVRAAYELPGEGQGSCAKDGQSAIADARQPNGDAAGHGALAQDGQSRNARPSPAPSSGEGHSRRADKAIDALPSPAAPDRETGGHGAAADKAISLVPPAREPSASDRKAAAVVAKASAKTVLDLGWLGRDSVPGGPKYTDLRWRDIAGMVERQLKEGATHAKAALALKMIEREGKKLGQVDPENRWVNDLRPETVRGIAKATEDDALKPSLVAWLRGGNELTQNMISEGRHA